MIARPVTDPIVASRLARARLGALSDMPYLAAALTSMVFLEVDDLGTVAIDRRLRTYVDPVAVMSWTLDELSGAILHEANHFLRAHHDRAPRGSFQARRWNIAADLEINDDLQSAGVTLPRGALLPAIYGLEPNKPAEWYFDRLHVETISLCVNCGSGATGAPCDWELTDDGVGLPRSRVQTVIDAVAEAIRNEAPGTVPGGLSRWANACGGRVHWSRVLRSVVRSAVVRGAGQSEHSWTSPNRRIPGPVLLPRLRARSTDVLCVIDTSGSMSEVDLSLALGEVAAVCKAVPSARVWLASCDTEATFHGSATGLSRVELRGGGGTSLEAALEVMDTHRINPSAVVFLTDGFTTWSNERPQALNGKAALVVSPTSSPDAPDWAVHIRCQ